MINLRTQFHLDSSIKFISCASLLLLFSCTSFAMADNCPAIDCDCDSLEVEIWEKACRSHESTIKKNCQANRGVARDYCAIHGPAATPLPLLTELDDVTVLPRSDIALSNRKIASIYWSIKSDVKVTEVELKEGRYGDAMKVLKSVELNTVTLFDIQRAVALSHASYENEDSAANTWEKFAEDSSDLEKHLSKVLKKWRDFYDAAEDLQEKSAYKLSLIKLYRIQGRLAEQSALAFGYSGKHAKAARSWSSASKNSQDLLEFANLADIDARFKDYFRFQTAARLQRVSYQWQLADEISKANEALQLSSPYENEPEIIKVWLLDEPAPDEQPSVTGSHHLR